MKNRGEKRQSGKLARQEREEEEEDMVVCMVRLELEERAVSK